MAYTPAAKNKDLPIIAKEAHSKQSALVALVQKFEPQIKLALPKHLTPERITRIIITEIRKNPLLVECDQTSLFAAIIQTAQLGLEPGSGLGQAYILPYRNQGKYEAQFLLGYQGMIELAERSGQVTVDAAAVYANDVFDYALGTDAYIKHCPALKERGDFVGAYATARYKDGRIKFRFLGKDEIEKARMQSQVGRYNKGPWKDFYAEMAMKTAIRRLFKLLPKSPEILRAQALDDDAEMGRPQDFSDALEMIGAKSDTALPSEAEVAAAKDEFEGEAISTEELGKLVAQLEHEDRQR